jgi:hypothetical protein
MKRTATLWVSFLFFGLLNLVTSTEVHAQIDKSLSVQGLLKKASGVAVNDGTYSITFKLYDQATGGTPLWTDVLPTEVVSGIYSATLGRTGNTLDALPFDQMYYLGVTVGSTEIMPRTPLTSAPYSLSLVGTTNKFPSSGAVRADSARVVTNLVVGTDFPTTHTVVALGGYLARGGTPGLNGANNNGYAFDGNSGDKDSGLFSTVEGRVSLYVNNAEVLAATPGAATVGGSLSANNVAINSTGSVSYNGQGGWRLVETNYFEGGDDNDWQYSNPDPSSSAGAWKNAVAGSATTVNYNDIAGWVIKPGNNDQVFKKQFNPGGSFTYIKVVFKYFAIGNWDHGDGASAGFAAFSNNANGSDIRIGWDWHPQHHSNTHNYNNDLFRAASSFDPNPANVSDQWTTGEMIGRHSGPFWVFFGYANNENTVGGDNENFAVGGIEIWVK